MSDAVTRLFSDYDRGRITRRHLLHALGVAAVVRPALALSQGQCGGARAGTPGCDTTPAKLPFEPTGWTTVLLDHFSCQVADYQKEAAYYATLMNWKIRSDDGTKAVLDIGDDTGAVIIRGGYPVPAPVAAAPPAAPVTAGATGAGAAPGGGRAGGPRAPRVVVWDSFCWGIDPWNATKVEAELRKRGLDPVADNDGKDFQSFHVKDPDGFDVQVSNGNRKNRRQGAAKGKMTAPAPFERTAWKTVWLDHISFQCSNYKESAAFYHALLGWKLLADEGSQNECQIGDVGNIIIRRGGGGGGRATQTPPPARHANIDHIAFGITPWGADPVKAELDKRGLTGRADTGANGDIHTAPYQSYHTTTPSGLDLQISNGTRANRNTR